MTNTQPCDGESGPNLNQKRNGTDCGADQMRFEEQFQQVMRQCSSIQITHLIGLEAEMTKEMRELVQARDCEIDRLEKACELNLATSSRDLAHFDQHSQQLSHLNTEIRQTSIDYSRQIEALLERQRRDYRCLVGRLFRNEKIDRIGQNAANNGSFINGGPHPGIGMASSLSHSAGFDGGSLKEKRNKKGAGNESKGKFKKSISCEEKMSSYQSTAKNGSTGTNHSESFSIYIGSQLKTMHNARILSCIQLSDLCLSHTFSPSAHGRPQHDDSSERLHLLMSLYGRELSAVVLIVGPDPRWHAKRRTPFARLCEQSAELHFDSLEAQLAKIDEQVRSANRRRRLRRANADLSQLSYSPPQNFDEYDENMLQPGDVYVTRHSNLSAVQLVFHLVGDAAIEGQEISSRHPCISGLRNIVRLAARSAIRNISLPLLLLDQVEPDKAIFTPGWCQSRAELVFKCFKGFLMEVCSSGSNFSALAPAAGPAQSLHFNINFAIPLGLARSSPALFPQMVDLFTSIYYLVPSFNA